MFSQNSIFSSERSDIERIPDRTTASALRRPPSSRLANLLLPAAHPKHSHRFASCAMVLDSDQMDLYWVNVRSTDGSGNIEAKLETQYFYPREFSAESKCIIYIPGNLESGIRRKEQQELANEHDAIVVGFNYRGVGLSTSAPRKFQDLVNDGIAQVQVALDNGIKAENIVLHGRSMGGGVATYVAEHFHQKGQKVKLFNERSYTSLADVGMGYVKNTVGINFLWKGWVPNPFSVLNLITYPLAWVIIKSALIITGWNANAKAKYDKLPSYAKECVGAKDDPVITNNASLVRAVNCTPAPDRIITHSTAMIFTKGNISPQKKKKEMNITREHPHCAGFSKYSKEKDIREGVKIFKQFVEGPRQVVVVEVKGQKGVEVKSQTGGCPKPLDSSSGNGSSMSPSSRRTS